MAPRHATLLWPRLQYYFLRRCVFLPTESKLATHLESLQLPRSPSQPPNVQENTTANQESRNSPRSPSRDSFPDLEAAPSSSAVVDNDVPEREHSPETSRPFRSRLLTAGAVLILGVLPLIVLPGVIMGALTGQILMGIALSSAVATVVGVFAGCYYYINRQG